MLWCAQRSAEKNNKVTFGVHDNAFFNQFDQAVNAYNSRDENLGASVVPS